MPPSKPSLADANKLDPTPDPAAAALQALTPGLGQPPVIPKDQYQGTDPAKVNLPAGPQPYDSHTSPVAPNASPNLVTPKVDDVASKPAQIKNVTPTTNKPDVSAPPGAAETANEKAFQKMMPDTAPSAADVQAKTQEVSQAAQSNPKIGQQIMDIAKMTGKTLLEVVQGMAYGMGHSDKPIQAQVEETRNLAEKQIEAEKQRQIADQQFTANMAKIQQNYLQAQFDARNQQEVNQAELDRKQQADQEEKNRQNQRDIAGLGIQYGKQGGYNSTLGGIAARGGVPQG